MQMSAISYEASPFRSHPPPTAALALMSLCSGMYTTLRRRAREGFNAAEVNSFPSHDFFTAARGGDGFMRIFTFLPPPPLAHPFLPYSASPLPRGVKSAPRGTKRRRRACSVFRPVCRGSCAQLPLEQESEPFANSESRFWPSPSRESRATLSSG